MRVGLTSVARKGALDISSRESALGCVAVPFRLIPLGRDALDSLPQFGRLIFQIHYARRLFFSKSVCGVQFLAQGVVLALQCVFGFVGKARRPRLLAIRQALLCCFEFLLHGLDLDAGFQEL